ncbi:MAG: PaREP1 family protein [Thermofilaceae archaeon]
MSTLEVGPPARRPVKGRDLPAESEGSAALKRLEAAWGCYEKAMELLSGGDPYDAAEKVWEAVWHATLALAEKYMGSTKPPERVTWREFVKGALVRAGLDEGEAEEWAAFFIDVRSRLHGEVYLARWYEEEEHKRLMERAEDYLRLVERLLCGFGASEA